MWNKRLNISTLLFLTLGLALNAQVSINSTGSNVVGGGGSVSYTVGQVLFNTSIGATGSVAQGVQQPIEISEVIGIDEAKGIILGVMAYPNPTTNYLSLEVKGFELINLRFELYDMNGKLLQSKKITDMQTSIVMSNISPANYLLKVKMGSKEVKSFKIIRH